MYLVYLGESGNTGTSTGDTNQPHHVHAGLLVHETQALSVNGEFNALFRRHFGHPPGEPGAPPSISPADLFQGRGFFRSWAPDARARIIQDCLNILIRRETPLIVSYVDKSKFAEVRADGGNPNAVWQTPAEPVISRFLLALNMFVDELNMSKMDGSQLMEREWPIADYAMVVATASESLKPGFMSEFLRSPDGIDATALLDNVCYAGPEPAAGTQLANLCAYFTRRWLHGGSRPQPYFDALRDGKVVQVIYPVTLD